MATRETPNTFLQWWKKKKSFNDESDPPGSHINGSSGQSRILDIERAERAERAELIQRADRLCASQKDHSHSVLERLGFSVQHDSLPSPQPPASPGRSPESSVRAMRIRPILDSPPLNVKESNSGRKPATNQVWDDEDPFFEKKVHLGSQMAIVACKLAKLRAKYKSPSPDSSISSVDTHTPSELRAISQICTPTPPPAAATRRASRLPVMSGRLGGAGKDVADGCRLQSVKTKVEEFADRLDKFQHVHRPSPRPPAAPKKTLGVTPITPKPPTTAAPPNKKGPRCGSNLRPTKADNKAGRDDIRPLGNPSESLSLCLRQFSSEDWEKKTDGFKSVRALALHHPALLQTKLHEVCLALAEEVSNLRSVVSCAAIETIAELHVQLGRVMDPEAEMTCRALLLKLAKTTNVFVHQQVNLALDALVKGCSPGRLVSALLNTGLSHRCVAVRGSTAQHLHQLAEIVGKDQILTAGKTFAERFLIAVSKMSVDAASEVRHHGQKMLQGLAHQREFMVLWDKVIPVKDRCPLEKILKKMRQ